MCDQIGCGCGHSGIHIGQKGHDVRGSCPHGHGLRRFLTEEEIIAEVEEYLGEVRAEIKGAEERLAELRKGV